MKKCVWYNNFSFHFLTGKRFCFLLMMENEVKKIILKLCQVFCRSKKNVRYITASGRLFFWNYTPDTLFSQERRIASKIFIATAGTIAFPYAFNASFLHPE